MGLVLCSVAGVQSQSITVDRQMKRYNVPRLAFVNKCDRAGANPFKVIEGLRNQLKLNAAAIQIPIGLEGQHSGVIDLVEKKIYFFEGEKGENFISMDYESEDAVKVLSEFGGKAEIFDNLVEEKRNEMIEKLGEVDDDIGELFLETDGECGDMETFTPDLIKKAIQKQVIDLNFVPVLMGSA